MSRMFQQIVVTAVSILIGTSALAAEPVFKAGGYAFGRAWINGLPEKGSLAALDKGSRYGDLAVVTSPYADYSKSYAHLWLDNGSQNYTKRIVLTSSANPQGRYKEGVAEIYTSDSNRNVVYVDVYVGPGANRDPIGKRVTMSLYAQYSSTVQGSGQNQVFLAYLDGSQYKTWVNTASGSSTPTSSGTRSFPVQVGKTYRIAMYHKSWARTTNSLAKGELRLDITTR